MQNFIITWLITTLALFIISRLRIGIDIDDIGTTFVAALVLGLLNAIVLPILRFLTLPITIFTLGLFLLVLNALILMLMAAIVKGVHLRNGFTSALIGSIILSIFTWVISTIAR